MIQKAIVTLLCILLAAILIAIATGNSFLITAVERVYLQGNTTANINDHTAFYTRAIKTSDPKPLPNSKNYNKKALTPEFNAYLEEFDAAAYLVIEDGEVVNEHYFNGYTDRSKTNSFSMAKTVLTMMVGAAIESGYIDSLEQKLTDFLPEFKSDPLAKNATIGNLSLMNSGYEWTEHYYSALSPTVELLYGPDIEDFLLKGKFTAEPGSFWEYSSASTQLLGIVLKRALEQNGVQSTLSEYLSDTIWQPLNMNDDALWHTDDSDLELVFCCLNTNARNYAKLGLLMLNQGKWNNTQVIPADFINKMIQPLGQPYYGYSTWLNLDKQPPHYMFSGHLGQFIVVVPEHNMVVVRLGERNDTAVGFMEITVPKLVEQALKLIN